MKKSNSIIQLADAIGSYDHHLLQGISRSQTSFHTHHDVANVLKNKHPYTITVLIEPLKWELHNKKEYVKKTKRTIISKYQELLYEYFFKEFGESGGNELYREWLNTYQSNDEVIIKKELETRYRQAILARYKNHEKLFKSRTQIDRERYYRLPEPLNYIDWRNPYDNIFIWEENGRKVAVKGGSGSSGGRERNTLCILGLLEINRQRPIPSHLFIYTDKNELKFLKKFDRLCVPSRDIGANYPSYSFEKLHHDMQGEWFIEWDLWDMKQI